MTLLELAEFIRLFSRHGRPVSYGQLLAVAGSEQQEPKKPEETQAYLDLVLMRSGAEFSRCIVQDLAYYYCPDLIATRYLTRWQLIQNGQVLEAMATDIRHMSQLNELVPDGDFLFAPYPYDDTRLKQAHAELLAQFPELGYLTDNEGQGYWFDKNHISPSYADVLANYDPFEYSV